LISDGFSSIEVGKCVRSLDGEHVIIFLYMWMTCLFFYTFIDIVIITKSFLSSKCDMKDMVKQVLFLEIEES